MCRLRSPSPPPSIQHQPPLLPPFPFPTPLPYPHPQQHQPPPLLPPFPAPLPYLHPPQPQRVDYTARLMQNFNSDHQRCHSRRSNYVPTFHIANAHAGPVHSPFIPHQNVINFQHEADQ